MSHLSHSLYKEHTEFKKTFGVLCCGFPMNLKFVLNCIPLILLLSAPCTSSTYQHPSGGQTYQSLHESSESATFESVETLGPLSDKYRQQSNLPHFDPEYTSTNFDNIENSDVSPLHLADPVTTVTTPDSVTTSESVTTPELEHSCSTLENLDNSEDPASKLCIRNEKIENWISIIEMADKYSQVLHMRSSDDSEYEEEEEDELAFSGPRIRSPLARAMYGRMMHDKRHRGDTHDELYHVDVSEHPQNVKDRFIQFYQDRGTREFLDNCYEKGDWIFTQLYQGFMKSVLTWFMTTTSANGFLGRGSMFVFSKEQFRKLMRIDADYRAERMIDLGAGDGKVTKMMSDHYDQVYATEVSTTMQSRLRASGFNISSIEDWPATQYDLISCLNLLDRCEHPLSVLKSIINALKPGGRVIIGNVLPYIPYVETVPDHSPAERLNVKGSTFDRQLLSLIVDVFEPLGLDLVSYTRLPYLCEGDLYRTFYTLDDAVFVLKLKDL